VGNSDLSRHLFYSLIDTIFLLLVGLMLMLMVRDFVKLIVRSRTLQRFEYVRSGTDAVITRIVQISRVIIVFTMACYILEAWLRAESAVAVMNMVFSWGVSLGGLRIDIGLVVIIVVCLYSAIIISYIVQAVLSETTLKDDSIEHGVRVSIFKIIHYAFVFIGLMLALMVLGVNWQSITIIGGALGVGIGFGLQEIVRNFISGLILLFERPIKVGDYVTIEGQWGEIKRLGLRSTVVQVFDRSEIVVPNHDLIDQKVTNWTLSDRLMRIIIEVGVAYGSDVEMVMTVLKECAMASSKVTRMPEPQAVFMKFGESSLDFELRVWITNIDEYVFVTSFLHQEIDKRFRKAGITIAFPQRDLHIRSMEAPSET
jgi:small-conductance mechanosensitive channel